MTLTNHDCFIYGFNKAKSIPDTYWKDYINDSYDILIVRESDDIESYFYRTYKEYVYDCMYNTFKKFIVLDQTFVDQVNKNEYVTDKFDCIEDGVGKAIKIWLEDFENIEKMAEYFVKKYS